jgi:hypothetical protein
MSILQSKSLIPLYRNEWRMSEIGYVEKLSDSECYAQSSECFTAGVYFSCYDSYVYIFSLYWIVWSVRSVTSPSLLSCGYYTLSELGLILNTPPLFGGYGCMNHDAFLRASICIGTHSGNSGRSSDRCQFTETATVSSSHQQIHNKYLNFSLVNFIVITAYISRKAAGSMVSHPDAKTKHSAKAL